MQELKQKEKKKLEDKYKQIAKEVKEFEDKRYFVLYVKLSEAYQLGKKIYGRKGFSQKKLAEDFNLGYGTVRRIMSLRYANKRTMKAVKEGKISIKKVSMILKRNSAEMQDELVEEAIKKGLTVEEIAHLTKYEDREEYLEKKQDLSINRGYSEREHAYRAWKSALSKMHRLVLINPQSLPKKKIKGLREQIENVKYLLIKYEKSLERGKHWLE